MAWASSHAGAFLRDHQLIAVLHVQIVEGAALRDGLSELFALEEAFAAPFQPHLARLRSRERSPGCHEGVSHEGVRRHGIIAGPHHTALHRHAHQGAGPQRGAPEVLRQLLHEVALQLGPEHAPERDLVIDRGGEGHGARRGDRERVAQRGLAVDAHPDTLTGLEVPGRQSRANRRGPDGIAASRAALR